MPDVTVSYGRAIDLIMFFWVFSYIIDDLSCLKSCIFTKHSQIAYLINVHISICQNAKCHCTLWNVLLFNCVPWKFSYITICLKRYSFIKLLQKCRDKKLSYVIIYGYVSLSFSLVFISIWYYFQSFRRFFFKFLFIQDF